MTTNPEQTVTPLSDAEVADLREWTNSHRLTAQSDAILRLCATVDALQHKLATARRQRDERPAGRVVWRGKTIVFDRSHPEDGSFIDVAFTDDPELPPGTEVAVVVLADDGAQTPEHWGGAVTDAEVEEEERCGARGPRIGNEGSLACVRPKGHDGYHEPDPSWRQHGWPQ